ncbi:hypothetical protein HPB50_024586 [Hyalomma asiaticum]|uniref:Uncharacterized protein n=1 Tax=Hyalomma asiaticum TaxID=266040 RepID=A0ACB7RQW9_HYAAI|nr:hypothetical protein HPB50_024586 [Hyalomma asiaticum]
MAVVLRAMICLLGALSALLALSVTSVIDLWMAASDVVFVLLFPQLVSLFYLNRWTNSYGAFLGFVVGAVLRGLCGERSLGIPVVLQLPMYDAAGAEQRFPFRTFCMLTSLSAMMVGSHMARLCFEGGWLPKTFDVCGCFKDTRRRRRASSFYGDKELSKSVLTSPGGPSSNDAEPPSHAETGTVLSSPGDGTEHPPHTQAEVQDHKSDMAEAPDNRTNVVEAQEHRTNTAEAHDHRHRTNTAEARDHRPNAAESKERPRRKSSVSAKKKRRASKHAVTSPTKRREDDPGAEAAGKTSP